MFKLDRKLIISASVAATVALYATGCFTANAVASTVGAKSQLTIDGGLVYPIVHGKTGPYYVDESTLKGGYTNGRTPTANEIKAWDKDVMADGTGLPEGEGSVEDGEAVYEAKCVSCHGDFGSGSGSYPALSKGNAVELQKTLKNQRVNPDADGPVRVFGSYWPQASTLWWYIRDGMPHPMSKTLTDNEVYALTAYILYTNEMSIDGEEVDEEYVLDREKFLKIKMPNVDGFEPNIAGANSLPGVRAYYANPLNFGIAKVKPADRCMKDCQKPTAKVTRIQNGGISEFLPPMSVVRDLPVVEEVVNPQDEIKKIYEDSCKMCHGTDGMGAPVVGDKPVWAKVTDKGIATVYSNGINGINGMPPKGGADLSEDKFKSIVDYMIKESK
jgi:cytochrome c